MTNCRGFLVSSLDAPRYLLNNAPIQLNSWIGIGISKHRAHRRSLEALFLCPHVFSAMRHCACAEQSMAGAVRALRSAVLCDRYANLTVSATLSIGIDGGGSQNTEDRSMPYTDENGRVWSDFRLAFDSPPSRKKSGGGDIAVSRDEMTLLSDVKNTAFRLYFLLQSRENWTALELIKEFWRDTSSQSRRTDKITRVELAIALKSLWKEGLITLSIPESTNGVIHVFSNFTGNHSWISGMIASWVKRGHQAEISRGSVNKKIRNAVFARDQMVCRNCGSTKQLTIDHIKPVSRGGTDDLNNLQVLCRSCNSKKHAKYAD